MKPEELRRRRKLVETSKAARGEELEAWLDGKRPTEVIKPELIPSELDLEKEKREFKRLVRRLEKTSKLTKQGRYQDFIDELMVCLARIIFLERVCELDRLARAGLTVEKLVALSAISPTDLQRRLGQLRGETDLVVPG